MTTPAARDPRGRFRPGMTGNPAGRPRGASPARRLERMVPALIERAVERAMQPDAPDELIAATLGALVVAEMAVVLRAFDAIATPSGGD